MRCFVSLLAVSLLLTSGFAQTQKPRIFITDSQSWETSGNAGGSNGTFAAHSAGGARPQTAEIIKTFNERCPDVVVNNRSDKADYVVLLDHDTKLKLENRFLLSGCVVSCTDKMQRHVRLVPHNPAVVTRRDKK